MDKSKRSILDEFGKALMTNVRDDTFSYLQRLLSGQMADVASAKVYGDLQKLSPKDMELLERVLALAVDGSLARFLNFIDEFGIALLFRTRTGEAVDIRAISDGLAGELHTDDGWIARFSAFSDSIKATG